MRNNNDPLTRTKIAGCRVCIIQLECGTKIETTYLEIRVDLFSRHNATITRLDINPTDQLKHLLTKISEIDNLPHMETIAQARQQFIEDIQLKMSKCLSINYSRSINLMKLQSRFCVICKQFVPL